MCVCMCVFTINIVYNTRTHCWVGTIPLRLVPYVKNLNASASSDPYINAHNDVYIYTNTHLIKMLYSREPNQ